MKRFVGEVDVVKLVADLNKLAAEIPNADHSILLENASIVIVTLYGYDMLPDLAKLESSGVEHVTREDV